MNKKRASAFLGMLTISIVLIVGFAIPAFAMGKPGGSGGSGGGGGGSGGTGGAGGVLSVSCIEWATTGGREQHLHVQAFVADQNGNPVLDADVQMIRTRNGGEDTQVGGVTGSYAGLDGGVHCPDGPPGTGVTADFCINSAPAGFYEAEVISVTLDGYTWDGVSIAPNNTVDYPGKL